VKQLRIDEEANTELVEAAEYYASDNPAVAWRFVRAVVAAIEAVHAAPHEWPLAPDVPERLGVHRRRVEGFPHSIVYAFNDTEVRILAIAHGKREPGYWRSRLRRRG
jgi:plasmid stabilization system protein ParE